MYNEVTGSLLHNNLHVTQILEKFSFGGDILMDTRYDGEYKHDEANVTIVSFVLNRAAAAIAAGTTNYTMRTMTDDADVFVLLMVYWLHRKDLMDSINVQVERCGDNVLNSNETCQLLGSESLKLLMHALLMMHALSGCDITSYPSGKG